MVTLFGSSEWVRKSRVVGENKEEEEHQEIIVSFCNGT